MKISLLPLALLPLLCACEKSAFVSYDLKDGIPVKAEVFSQGFYATFDGKDEQVGTVTAITFLNEYSQGGDTLFMDRTFISDASKGYLKKSHPGELMFRTPELRLSANAKRANNQVESIEGYENFDSAVVAKVSIPEKWKEQINRMARPIDLERIERRRWELGHLIRGEAPLKTNITQMLASKGSLPTNIGAQIDSVVTGGIKSIDGKKCLEYTVYLQEKEPFPYFIWEQHVASVKSAEKFKSYHPKEAAYINRYEIAISLENGIPCQEKEFKSGLHGMQNPESGDSVVFKSQITLERHYKL